MGDGGAEGVELGILTKNVKKLNFESNNSVLAPSPCMN